ncbi:uncharacterized protein LOC144149000 [Haemaphysalis longicornis]
MAQQTEGFQEDTIQDFLCYVSVNMPDFSEDQMELLKEYIDSVNVTCEAELYKINEEDLGKLVGVKEAKLIMQYLRAKLQPGAPEIIVTSTEVGDEKQQSEEQPQGAVASSASSVLPRIDLNCGELTTMFEKFLIVQISEGEKNRQAMQQMLASSVDSVTQKLGDTVEKMSSMMKEQFKKQDELMEKINKQTISMNEKMVEYNAVQRQELLQHIQNVQSKSQAEAKNWMESAHKSHMEAFHQLQKTMDDVQRSAREKSEASRNTRRCCIQ